MDFVFMIFSAMSAFGAPSSEPPINSSYEQCLEDCLAFADEPDHWLKACVRACEDLIPSDVLEDVEGWESGQH